MKKPTPRAQRVAEKDNHHLKRLGGVRLGLRLSELHQKLLDKRL